MHVKFNTTHFDGGFFFSGDIVMIFLCVNYVTSIHFLPSSD